MDLLSTRYLLSLPEDEAIRMLRKMSLEQILDFSLISERCKNLVTSIQIKATSFRVDIHELIYVYIGTGSGRLEFYFYNERDKYWGMGADGRKKKLTAPQTVKNRVDDIKEVFGTATQVSISNTGCYAFNQIVLQNFLPVEKLKIKPANFYDAEIPGNILMQNFDYLDIDSRLEEATSMTLEELLLINSKKSHIGFFRISAKQINKFIKLWQKGSNPRMEYLGIHYTNVNEGDKEVIMNGISHQVIPADRRRRFKPAENGMPEVVKGGIDVSRRDGVKATILFRGRPFPVVEMLVWFDHCVGEF